MSVVPILVASVLAVQTGLAEPTEHQWQTCNEGAVAARLEACAAIADNPAFDLESRAYAAASLGDLHLDQQQFNLALSEFSRAIRLSPDYSYSHRRRAFVQFLQERHDAALAGYSRAVELSPLDAYAFVARSSFYRQTEKWDLARQDIERALKLDLSNPDFYYERGLLSLDVKDYEQAELDFLKSIALNPDDHDARYNLANAIRYQSRSEDALEQIGLYIENEKQDAQGYRMRGWLQADLGRYDEAFANFQTASGIQPDDPTLHYALGYVHWRRGEFQNAVDSYSLAEPGYDQIGYYFYERGYSRFMLNQDKLALDDANRALQIEPADLDAMWLKGAALLYLDDYAAAMETLNKAARIDPENVEILVLRGRVQIAAKHFFAAIGDLSKALDLQPDHGSAEAYRGYAGGLAGNMNVAHKTLDALIEKHPDKPLTYELAARLFYHDEDFRTARNYSQRLVDLAPEDASYKVLHGDIVLELEQYSGAAVMYQAAINSVSEPPAGWIRLAAYAEFKADNKASAFELLKRARLADPDNTWTSGMLGDFWLEKSEFDKALQSFEHAIGGVENERERIGFRLSRAKALAGTGSRQAALDELTILAKEQPDNTDVTWARADVFLALGRTDEALAEFENYRRRRPASLEAHYKLIDIMIMTGRTSQALELAERAIYMETEKSAGYRARARIYLQMDNFLAAGTDLRKAIELRPDNAELQALFARAQLGGGSPTLALEPARRAVELAPQSESHQLLLAEILIAADDAQAALFVLDTVIVLNRDLAEAHYLKAKAHKALGQAEMALAALRIAEKLDDGKLSPQIAGLQGGLR